ncbi:MAG: ATPase domain-containing protein [Candidatus Woesearchaeota archaeon]
MNRIPTRIKGFDELVQGGFPEHSIVLLSGSPGTGKSIFGMEYVYKGALHYGDVSMYVSFEQSPKDLREQAKQLGFSEIERLEQEGTVILSCIPVNDINKDSVYQIITTAREAGAKRLVVDSLSALSINAPVYASSEGMAMQDVVGNNTILSPPIIGDDIKKNFIYRFVSEVKNIPTTALLISEIPENASRLSSDGVSEFAADGVVVLKKNTIGEEVNRTLHLEKMRLTKIGAAMKEFDIGDGFIVQ